MRSFALCKIAINLLYGDEAGEPLDEERMRELVEAADAERSSPGHSNACRPYGQHELDS